MQVEALVISFLGMQLLQSLVYFMVVLAIDAAKSAISKTKSDTNMQSECIKSSR
jgi:hypothetical protein